MSEISTAGIILYILYPVILISISFYSVHGREVTPEVYFFADRKMPWWILGFSFLTASAAGPLFILIASGTDPLSSLITCAISMIMILLLSRSLAHLYQKNKIRTFPEYFEIRFDRKCRLFLSAVYIVNNIFLRLVVVIIMGSIFINMAAGYDAFTSLIYFLVIAGLYVINGGIKSEMNTNVIHAVLIIIAMAAVTGWNVSQNISTGHFQNKITPLFFSGSAANPEITPAGLAAGLPVIGFWFWCMDQMIVQKLMSGKSLRHIRKSGVFAVILQLIPAGVFIYTAPFLQSVFRPAIPASLQDGAFAGSGFPVSMRLFFIMAVLSVMMTSTAAIFNSTSALVTFDFFRTLKPGSSERKLVLVGRLTTLMLLFFSILLIPTTQVINAGTCMKLIMISSYLAAMTAAVFIAGLLSKKIRSTGAFITLCLAAFITGLRVVSELVYEGDKAGNMVPDWLVQLNFLEFSAALFLLSLILPIAISGLSTGISIFRSFIKSPKENLIKLKYKWNTHRKVF